MSLWDQFLQILISGIAVGSLYAIVALGLMIVESVTRYLNFLAGTYVMLGGMVTVTFVEAGVPLVPAILLTLVIVCLGNAVVWRVAVYPLQVQRASGLTVLMVLLGVATFTEGLAYLVWGWQPRDLDSFFSGTFHIFGATVFAQVPEIIIVTLLMILGVYLLLDRTFLGKSMRACADRPVAARLMGISPLAMSLAAFTLAAFLSTLAGAIITPWTTASYIMGFPLTIKGFIAANVGGLTRAEGVIAGALALGILEQGAAGYLPAGYKDAIALGVFLLILLVRPTGVIRAHQWKAQ